MKISIRVEISPEHFCVTEHDSISDKLFNMANNLAESVIDILYMKTTLPQLEAKLKAIENEG